MRLIDLLDRWTGLAPNECKPVRQREGVTSFDVEIATIEVIHQFDPIEDRKVLAIVQGAVQQRIVDRGLSLDLKMYPGYPRIAKVLGKHGATLTEASHEITAFAVLEAYLKQLTPDSNWTTTELKQ